MSEYLDVTKLGFWVGVGAVVALVWFVPLLIRDPVVCWPTFGFGERARLEAERQRQAAMAVTIRNLALTCRRCPSLAPPIIGTGNRYKCEQCGNQFAGARHGQ